MTTRAIIILCYKYIKWGTTHKQQAKTQQDQRLVKAYTRRTTPQVNLGHIWSTLTFEMQALSIISFIEYQVAAASGTACHTGFIHGVEGQTEMPKNRVEGQTGWNDNCMALRIGGHAAVAMVGGPVALVATPNRCVRTLCYWFWMFWYAPNRCMLFELRPAPMGLILQ